MDSGDWGIFYTEGEYSVGDEGDYFPVYLEHKQIAAFKTKRLALEYVMWKLYKDT